MIHLRTLSSIELCGTRGESLDAVLVQPKRLALLAYLVLARPRGFQRRDVLLGLFWPESDAPHARDALNQTLRFLRRYLGKDVLQSRGNDEVGLDPSRLYCDAVAFEEHIAAGDDAAALALYRSELLEGLFVSEAPLFEQWLDTERSRLRDLARGAAQRLATAFEAAGQPGEAVRWTRRALQLAPFDEIVFRGLLELLDRTGDRATAIREYDAFARRLSAELEVEPAPETQRSITGIRARALPNELPRAAHVVSADITASSPLVSDTDVSHSLLPPQPVSGEAEVDGITRDTGARARWRLRRSAWFALGVLVAGTAAWIAVQSGGDGPKHTPLDPSVVAVLPFRVSGADPQLAYLREGMMDLLAAKLAGAGSMRAVDSRTLLAAWRRVDNTADPDPSTAVAVELARSLGSGRVLLGDVVGTMSRVVLTATLLDVTSGRSAAVASVQGPADSLTVLVDRLAVQLLSLELRSKEQGLADLTTASLPALMAYLDGNALSRRGRYRAAIERFDRAIAHDSTFALAALGLANAGGWVDLPAQTRGLALAWTLRDRLSARDSVRLVAVAGRRYPLPPTGVERIEDARSLLRMAPDWPEAWYWLGDALFHFGRYVGEEAPEEQAIHAFQEAIRLDSTFSDPMHHLIDLLAEREDTAAVRRFGRMYLAVDSAGETAHYLRWRIAASLRDEDAVQAFWNRVDSAPNAVLDWVLGAIQKQGIRLEDFDRVMEAFEPRGAWWVRARALLNRGRPAEAGLLLERRPKHPESRYPVERIDVFNALFWDGDAARGARAARKLAGAIGQPAPAEPGPRERHFTALCTAERWRAWHGELETVARSIERLRAASTPLDAPLVVAAARLCALELEAELAVQGRRADARTVVARLDSAYRAGPLLDRWTSALNLSLARLLEKQGDREGALAAVRRGTYRDIAPQIALSTLLREEGRLAALTGDSDGASRAYRHYLALRSDPEPGLRPQVERVRTELARLTSASIASTGSRASRDNLPVRKE